VSHTGGKAESAEGPFSPFPPTLAPLAGTPRRLRRRPPTPASAPLRRRYLPPNARSARGDSPPPPAATPLPPPPLRSGGGTFPPTLAPLAGTPRRLRRRPPYPRSAALRRRYLPPNARSARWGACVLAGGSSQAGSAPGRRSLRSRGLPAASGGAPHARSARWDSPPPPAATPLPPPPLRSGGGTFPPTLAPLAGTPRRLRRRPPYPRLRCAPAAVPSPQRSLRSLGGPTGRACSPGGPVRRAQPQAEHARWGDQLGVGARRGFREAGSAQAEHARSARWGTTTRARRRRPEGRGGGGSRWEDRQAEMEISSTAASSVPGVPKPW
jgi:hypothetical protein